MEVVASSARTAPCQIASGFTVENGSNTLGGGIYCATSSPSILDCRFSMNKAWTGGGIYASNSIIRVEDCEFTYNEATNGPGGGSCFVGGSPVITNCQFTGNLANKDGSRGGAVFANGAGIQLLGCTFSNNEASMQGGGLCLTNCTSAIISDCGLYANRAGWGDGGGLYMASNHWATVRKCVVRDNRATDSGGGIYLINDANAVIENCLIAGNTATDKGGGLRVKVNASPRIRNCTIVNNSANTGGGLSYSTASPTNENNVYWANTLDQINGGSASATYCCIQSWTNGGTGNITNNPLLIAASYRLRTNSPCIDHGKTNTLAADFDGEARFDHPGMTNAISIWDIGRDEFVDADGDGMADVWEIQYFGSLARNGTGYFDSDGLSDLAEYEAGTDPTVADSDGDGLSDYAEVVTYETSPLLADTDGDGMPDAWEVANGFNPTSAADALLDTDGDGVINVIEFMAGTSPTNAASPATNDTVDVWLTVGEGTNSMSGSERYAMTVNCHTVLTSSAYGTYTNKQFRFVRGCAYTCTVVWVDHDWGSSSAIDYDYYARVDGFGRRVATNNVGDLPGDTWYTNATKGLLIHDPKETLGEYWTDSTTPPIYPSVESAVMYIPRVDLAIIKPLGNQEVAEQDEETEGEILQVNIDDDDGDAGTGANPTPDKDDSDGVVGENDLIRLQIHEFNPPGLTGIVYKLHFSSTNIAVWLQSNKTQSVESDATTFLTSTTVFIEGLIPSASMAGETITLRAYGNVQLLSEDTVKIVVAQPILCLFGWNPFGYAPEQSLRQNYLDLVKKDQRTDPYVINRTSACYCVFIWKTDTLAKIALSTVDGYVSYDGHSNYGLGFAFPANSTSITSIGSFLNVGEPLVRISWSYLASEYLGFNVEYSEYGDDVSSQDLYDPWLKQSALAGQDETYLVNRFYSVAQGGTNAQHLALTYGSSPFYDYHQLEDGSRLLVVQGGASDMPAKGWKKVFLHGCYTGPYYLDVFHRGTVFFTWRESGSLSAIQIFVADIMDGMSDEEIWADLHDNANSSIDYQTF